MRVLLFSIALLSIGACGWGQSEELPAVPGLDEPVPIPDVKPVIAPPQVNLVPRPEAPVADRRVEELFANSLVELRDKLRALGDEQRKRAALPGLVVPPAVPPQSSGSNSGLTAGAPGSAPPPRDTPLLEKKFEALSNQTISEIGKLALGIEPEKWKHAETPNFILHYRRVTEAHRVAREVEYNLWYIGNALGATKEQLQGKSHVYIFEDEEQWQGFLALTPAPGWAASFTNGRSFYLNVRVAEEANGFDSMTFAHETTHAVVARLFNGKRWPLWLDEGFAEYVAWASVAARKGQPGKRFQNQPEEPDMPLKQLIALTDYPKDSKGISLVYQSSERCVRFFMQELPKERFPRLVASINEGAGFEAAVLAVYGDKFEDWAAFQRRYELFSK